MSRSYRAPFTAVTGVRSAADDKRRAARAVRRKQNQWLRTTSDFDQAVVPHRLECAGNEVWGWSRESNQHLEIPDDRAWSEYCLEQNGFHPYESFRSRDGNRWPPRWYVRLLRK